MPEDAEERELRESPAPSASGSPGEATQPPENGPGARARAPREGVLLSNLKSWDVVAISGLLTFVTTLAFEYGRAAYWGFPAELVSFAPENALRAFVRLAIGAVLLGLMLQVARDWKAYRILLTALGLVALGLGTWRIQELWGGLALAAALVGGMFSVLALGLALGLGDRRDENSVWLVRVVGRPGLALFAVLVLVPYASLAIGYFHAWHQERFVATTTEPRRIVLATYGTTAVCAALNTDERGPCIEAAFALVELTDERLGPVRVEELGRVARRSREKAPGAGEGR